MARAPEIHVADVYSAPNAVIPNAYKFTINCRFVAETHKLFGFPPALRHEAYIHWSGPAIIAGSALVLPPQIIIDTDSAERVEFPVGSGQFWVVQYTFFQLPTRAPLVPYRVALLTAA